MYEILHNVTSNAYRGAGPNFWRALDTPADLANAKSGPFWNGKVRDVSDPGMSWWKDYYLGQQG